MGFFLLSSRKTQNPHLRYIPQQEVLLNTLVPVQSAPAPSPTYTAFDPVSRQYFAVAGVASGLTLWGTTLSGDVNTSTPLAPFGVNVTGLAAGDAAGSLMSLEAMTVAGAVTVLAVFAGGNVYAVDPGTGAATLLAALLSDASRQVTQAVTVDPVNVGIVWVFFCVFFGSNP